MFTKAAFLISNNTCYTRLKKKIKKYLVKKYFAIIKYLNKPSNTAEALTYKDQTMKVIKFLKNTYIVNLKI